jgi:hypothetical protein
MPSGNSSTSLESECGRIIAEAEGNPIIDVIGRTRHGLNNPALTFVENLAAFRRPSEKVVYRFVLPPWESQP